MHEPVLRKACSVCGRLLRKVVHLSAVSTADAERNLRVKTLVWASGCKVLPLADATSSSAPGFQDPVPLCFTPCARVLHVLLKRLKSSITHIRSGALLLSGASYLCLIGRNYVQLKTCRCGGFDCLPTAPSVQQRATSLDDDKSRETLKSYK
eukprot:5678784-Amphidinium_carterae.1